MNFGRTWVTFTFDLVVDASPPERLAPAHNPGCLLARMHVCMCGLPTAPPFTGPYFRPAHDDRAAHHDRCCRRSHRRAGRRRTAHHRHPPRVAPGAGTTHFTSLRSTRKSSLRRPSARFLGAHEAAHVQQKPMGRRWIINALAGVLITYIAVLAAGLIRLGFTANYYRWRSKRPSTQGYCSSCSLKP